jgi:hypothetical protein
VYFRGRSAAFEGGRVTDVTDATCATDATDARRGPSGVQARSISGAFTQIKRSDQGDRIQIS